MRLTRLVTCLGPAITLAASSALASLPKYGPNAVPISRRTNLEYFQKNPAPDYWALSPYYTAQVLGQQCSAATITMMLNAARSAANLDSDTKLVTISSLLEKYSDDEYRTMMSLSASGPGLELKNFKRQTNKRLTEVLRESVSKLGIATPATQVVNGRVDLKHLDISRAAFHDALVANEKSADDFILISFIQGDLTGDPDGGAHVAAIGAYDLTHKLVLIMDPDREWYEPYWSPEDKVFDAVADPRSDGENPGWVLLKIR